MVGRQVRFALDTINNQVLDLFPGRHRQFDLRGERRTAHTDDTRLLDPGKNLRSRKRTFAHELLRSVDPFGPFIPLATDRNHHLADSLPVGQHIHPRHGARHGRMDIGRHETGGFGDQLSHLHLVALGHLRNRRRTDMLRQRNIHHIGQRQYLDGLRPTQLVIRRMYSASRKCLHSVCFRFYRSDQDSVFSVFFSSEAGFSPAADVCFDAGAALGSLGSGSIPTRRMAPVGHSFTHLRQSLHFQESMKARLFWIVMAPNGHTFSHFPQPIQPALQAFITTAPLSFDTHET